MGKFGLDSIARPEFSVVGLAGNGRDDHEVHSHLLFERSAEIFSAGNLDHKDLDRSNRGVGLYDYRFHRRGVGSVQTKASRVIIVNLPLVKAVHAECLIL